MSKKEMILEEEGREREREETEYSATWIQILKNSPTGRKEREGKGLYHLVARKKHY